MSKTKEWRMKRVLIVALLASFVVTAILAHWLRVLPASPTNKAERNASVKEFSPCVCNQSQPGIGEKDKQSITKQIVQTFKVPFEELPRGMKNAALTWKDLNPEYNYSYMDDDKQLEYVLEHGSDSFIKVFNASRSGAMRCDLFRALLIYREGGVYADIDTTLKTPLREILNPTDDLVSGLGGRGDLHQWFLAYAPCHPVLRKLLENICKYDASKLHEMGTEDVAGPKALHRAAAETLGEPFKFRFQPRTYSVKDAVGCRHNDTYNIRVLEGDLLDENVDFKYKGYFADLRETNVTYWGNTRRRL